MAVDVNFNFTISVSAPQFDQFISLGENFMATIGELKNVVDALQTSVSAELQQVIDLLTRNEANQAAVDDAVARLTSMNDALMADNPAPVAPPA